MPNIKSAKKRVLVSSTKTLRNKMIRSNLKTVLKQADAAVASKADNMEAAVTLAIKKVDQACAKGVLPKNTASRKKAGLARKLNAAKA